MPLISRRLFLFIPLILGLFSSLEALGQEEKTSLPPLKSWAAFLDQDYGATLYYPANWFAPAGKKEDFSIFSSLNDRASLSIKTYLDPLRTGAAETVSKLQSGTGAHRIKDIKQGEMWYELRMEPQPNMLLYSRVVYSCKERVVSQINLIYPAASAEPYEQMILKLKRRFQQGIGLKTPVRECS